MKKIIKKSGKYYYNSELKLLDYVTSTKYEMCISPTDLTDKWDKYLKSDYYDCIEIPLKLIKLRGWPVYERIKKNKRSR